MLRSKGAAAAVVLVALVGPSPVNAGANPVVLSAVRELPPAVEPAALMSWEVSEKPFSFSFECVGAPPGSSLEVSFVSDGRLHVVPVRGNKFGSGVQVNWSQARAVIKDSMGNHVSSSRWLVPPVVNDVWEWDAFGDREGFRFRILGAPPGSSLTVVWVQNGYVTHVEAKRDYYEHSGKDWSQARAVLRDAAGKVISVSPLLG